MALFKDIDGDELYKKMQKSPEWKKLDLSQMSNWSKEEHGQFASYIYAKGFNNGHKVAIKEDTKIIVSGMLVGIVITIIGKAKGWFGT